MQQEFDLLSAAFEADNKEECSAHFREFCAAFFHDLNKDVPGGIFSKIMKKKSVFQTGMEYINMIISQNMMFKMQLIDFIQSITQLFKFLMHYKMKTEIHYQSFDVFLTILDSFKGTDDTIKLKLLGDVMVYGLDLYQFIENPEEMYKFYIPDSKIEPEYNTHSYVKLYEKLLIHFKNNHDPFKYWWMILCESLFPVIFSATSTEIKLIKSPKYNLEIFANALLEPTVDINEISTMYPEYILFLISETAIKTAKPFFDKYHEKLPDIILAASDRFLKSVSSFLYAIIPILGTLIILPENNAAKLYFDEILTTWDKMVQRKPGVQNYILPLYADMIHANPDTSSIYTILLMAYKSNSQIPDVISTNIKNLSDDVLSISCGFSGVLAVAFLKQIFRLTDQQVKIIAERIPNDCGKHFIQVSYKPDSQSLTTVKTDQMRIIEAISVKFDTRPRLEADTFIKRFFDKWEQDIGLNAMYSTFTRTFVSALQILPAAITVNTPEILIPYLDKFTRVALDAHDAQVLVSSVDVVSLIVNTRDMGPHITPIMASRICRAILKLLSISIDDKIEIGLDIASYVLLSGNPMFMTIVPFMVYILQQEKRHPKPKVVPALEYALLFLSMNDVGEATQAIESKMTDILKSIGGQLSNSAKAYFNSNKRLKSPITLEILDVLVRAITKSYQMMYMSAVRLVHGFAASNLDVPRALEACFGLNLYNYLLVDGMYSLIDVAEDMRKNSPQFLLNLAILIEVHFNDAANDPDSKWCSQLMILFIELARRHGEKKLLEEFFEKLSIISKTRPDLIEVLLTYLANRKILQLKEDKQMQAIGMSSPDAFQSVVKYDNDSVLITSRYTSKSAYKFKIINENSENENQKITENVENLSEKNFDDSLMTHTAKLFSNLKKKIVAQNIDILSTPQENTQIKEDSNLDLPDHEPKNEENENEVNSTSLDSTVLAMYNLGLFGDMGTESLSPMVENQHSVLHRIVSAQVKLQATVPVFYAKNGNYVWKWEETSRDFQSFAAALGTPDTSTTRKFGDWRMEGKFYISPAEKEFNNTCAENCPVCVLWIEDGITLSARDVGADQSTIVISVQPLTTGFLRVMMSESKLTTLLTNTNVIKAESVCSMVRASVVTLCLGSEQNYPYELGKSVKENISKVASQFT